MRGSPCYVQRIRTRSEEATEKKGVDRWFDFDYMGSSEFEWGALPKALKEMKAEDLPPEPKRIKLKDEHVIWFVGPERLLPVAVEFFADQFRPRAERKRTHERVGLSESYSCGDQLFDDFDGWWCIDEGKPFVLFRKKGHARRWIAAL